MRDYWWLIPIALVSFLAAILPKAYGGVAIFAVAAAMALYMVLGGRFKLSAINGRRGVNAKGTLGVKERLAPQKDAVLSYRSLVDQISHALRVEADASWETFSAAYLRRESAEHALDAAFGAHPCFASFDWRDLGSCQDFVSQAGAALSPEEVLDASRCDSAKSQLKAFDAWLRLRSHILVDIDTGTDSYCCLVLPQKDAFAFLRVPPPNGVSLRATVDST